MLWLGVLFTDHGKQTWMFVCLLWNSVLHIMLLKTYLLAISPSLNVTTSLDTCKRVLWISSKYNFQEVNFSMAILLRWQRRNFKILGSESFTRWLVWGTSAWELGKIRKLLCPHCLWEHKVHFFTNLVMFECPHHLTLSASLKLHSFSRKIIICRYLPPPKIREKVKSNQ